MVKVLVVGEYCIDRFIYSDVKRFSPEAPVPVLVPLVTTENKGMSGNVVENLRSLNNELEITHWHQPEIITKTRYVEKKSNHMFLRVDEGEQEITPLKYFDVDLVNDVDIVIVSDYDKGFISDDILFEIGFNSRLSILDSKRKLTIGIAKAYDFVKLNETESKQNSELSLLPNIITTLGARGTKYQDIIYPSPKPQETIDVSGAGDTFTSAFILKYYETKSVEESIIFANEMSAIVVSKRGVATPK